MSLLIAVNIGIIVALCEVFGRHPANAGMCWLQQSQEPRCNMVLKRGVSREECCSGGRLDTAWSNASLPINEVSLLGFLGIISCKPCKGTLPGAASSPTSLTPAHPSDLFLGLVRAHARVRSQ
ncbi:hypothetical protein AAFF_G00150920 [Aldrovandia affinis]|uniref:TB domain-containing protein n=1 Tax=Aldrovandia affinis TaxID=143900 RepID=A0AAD7W8E5_9TELE|nr:hypothetical protein AAFF_G00150920 [Aldrovandia affinis]